VIIESKNISIKAPKATHKGKSPTTSKDTLQTLGDTKSLYPKKNPFCRR